jgi:hypothetical protein
MSTSTPPLDDIQKLTNQLQTFPIKVKGIVSGRPSVKGEPSIMPDWLTSMEQGRYKEYSITEASHALMKHKKDLENMITSYLDKKLLSVSGQLRFPCCRIICARNCFYF